MPVEGLVQLQPCRRGGRGRKGEGNANIQQRLLAGPSRPLTLTRRHQRGWRWDKRGDSTSGAQGGYRGGKMAGDRGSGTGSPLGVCGLWKSPEPLGTCTREGTNQRFLTKRP